MKSIIKTGAVLASILLSASHSYSQSNDNHSITTKQVMNTNQERTSNKDVIRNLYENILNERKFQLIDDLFSPDYKTNIAGGGIAAFKEQVSAIVKAIPDAHWEVLELIAEGNKVIVKQELHGTQTEQFRTFPPSGKKVANVGFGVYEFANGKIIESQVTTDRLGFLQEIGALPIDLSTLSQMSQDAVGPSLIDKFFVPKNSIAEFKKQLHINKSFIEALPGLIRMDEFEQLDSDGNLNFVTVARWKDQTSIDNAKAAVQAEFKRIGFNGTEFYQRLNIKLERGIYTKVN